MPNSFDDWREDLERDRLGRIWWNNLLFDVAHKNIAEDVNDRFLRAVEEALSDDQDYETPLALLGVTSRSFTLQGQRTPTVEPISRVLDADSFAHFNIDWERIGLGQTTLTEKVWQRFRDGKIVPELDFINDMKTGSGEFFWGTPTRCLEKVFEDLGIDTPTLFIAPDEKGDHAATEIRNLLGLSYMKEGVGLYRIDIPPEYLQSVKFCAPTTLDSSPVCVFLPADEQSSFGLTLHLDRLEPGAEEVVIGAVRFTNECKVTQLGFIRSPLPNEASVWERLDAMAEARLKPMATDSL